MRKSGVRAAPALALLAVCFACISYASSANATQSLLSEMAGTWEVQEKMWPGPGAAPIALPAAIAHRELIGDAFLREEMKSISTVKSEAFTRISYFNYNAVSQKYEYFSLDTRAPQMMTYTSRAAAIASHASSAPIRLHGGRFVAPQWGKMVNIEFRYRLTISGIKDGQQIVRLYLTPQSGPTRKEFLAFEYIYKAVQVSGAKTPTDFHG